MTALIKESLSDFSVTGYTNTCKEIKILGLYY